MGGGRLTGDEGRVNVSVVEENGRCFVVIDFTRYFTKTKDERGDLTCRDFHSYNR